MKLIMTVLMITFLIGCSTSPLLENPSTPLQSWCNEMKEHYTSVGTANYEKSNREAQNWFAQGLKNIFTQRQTRHHIAMANETRDCYETGMFLDQNYYGDKQ